MKSLGDTTYWGEIVAIGFMNGERYYWMIDKRGVVSMIPARVMEKRM